MPWNKDKANGPEDPIASESIILNQQTIGGLYEEFCNGTGGKTKL